MDFEQLTVVGNLGRDPELRYTPTGKPVVTFSLAVNSGKGAKWFKVTCWDALAEQVATHLRRGQSALVTGKIEARAYLDKSGQPAASLELTAAQVRFGDHTERQRDVVTEGDRFTPPDDMTDIPF